MIVDTHTHLRAPIQGIAQEGRKNIYGVADETIDEYLKGFDENGVDACWVFPLEGFRADAFAREEMESLARVCEPYPHRLFPFATIPPMWPEKRVCEMVERAVGELGFYGLKFVSICQGVSLANPSMERIAREAVRFGVPVFLHDGSPEYCSAIQVIYYARKYPELRVVSGHGGLREFWSEYIDGVRELPNLQICLSGPTQWGIQKLYDELGPDRLMFGSDGGIGSQAITRAYVRRLARLKAPEDDKRKIMGISGMRFLFGEDWEEVIAEKRSEA
jgi:predicted TIM-barrel fold metal-dependent hydrolase